MNQNIQNYVLLKFLLIGESGSGKTSLMIRYTDQSFLDNAPMAVIYNFCYLQIKFSLNSP